METIILLVIVAAVAAGFFISKRKSKAAPVQESTPSTKPEQPEIVNAVAAFMAPLALPEDADGSKMNRGEWDAYVAKYGKFPTTPAAPQATVIPPSVSKPASPVERPFFEDGHDWENQAALDEHRRRIQQRAANLKAGDAADAAVRYTGPVPAASLSLEDCRFLYHAYMADPGFAKRVLMGTPQEVAQALQLGSISGEYDWSTYTGVLRQYVK